MCIRQIVCMQVVTPAAMSTVHASSSVLHRVPSSITSAASGNQSLLHCRIKHVPLVCKRWSTLAADPSTWPHVQFSAGLKRQDGEVSANSLASLRWLQRHSGGIEDLVLQVSWLGTTGAVNCSMLVISDGIKIDIYV